MTENSNLTRKKFIQVLTRVFLSLAGLLGLGGLVRYFSYRENPVPPERIPIGTLRDFPDGSQTLLLEIPAVIIRSGDQIRAVSLTCTHLGCLVEPDQDSFLCPCHGSRFSDQGNLLKGPADKDLAEFEIETDDEGQIILIQESST
jgi:cytochrome b6-f complex iron-sulfur subunit